MKTYLPELGTPMKPLIEAIIEDFSTLEHGSEAHTGALRAFSKIIEKLSDQVDEQRAEITLLNSKLAAATSSMPGLVRQGHAMLSSSGAFYAPKQVHSITVHFVSAMPHAGYAATATLFSPNQSEIEKLQLLGIVTQSSYSVTVLVKNVSNVSVHATTARVNVVAVM